MYNPLEDLKNRVEDTQKIIEKYSDFKVIPANKLPFREPATDFEKKCAKKVKTGNITFLSIFAAVSLALLILVFAYKAGLFAYILMGVLLLISVIGLVVVIVNKPKISAAKVVTTNKQLTTDNKGKTKTSYNASVCVDVPSKLLAHGVKVSKRQYDRLNEGTDVIVVKAVNIKLYEAK